jgi:hypothetical protein
VPDAIIVLILNDYRGAIKVCEIAAVNKVISLSGRTAFSFSRETNHATSGPEFKSREQVGLDPARHRPAAGRRRSETRHR